MSEEPKHLLDKEAAQEERGMVSEFLDFLLNNKKWWLIPTLLILLALAGLVVLGGSGAAPFIYSLF